MQHVRRGYAALTNGGDGGEGGNRAHDTLGTQGRIEAPYRDEDTSDAEAEDAGTRGGGQ
ncbi:MAG: hypothetical protein L6R39_004636, partial [Caloplaca ligustica]